MIHEYSEKQAHFDRVFQDLCLGNQEAIQVCHSVFQFLHIIDDLVDKDHPVPVDVVGVHLLDFIETVALNPFFQKHREALCGCLRVGVLEWVDSEKWRAREDVREKLAAEVLKSQYQNFFYLIAGLCGGISHMAAMTAKHREYQWD
jgi:hypothetical protein